MKYLIISGGSVDDELLVRVVKNGGFEMLIAADSGMDALYRNRILPELIIGDMDSVDAEVWDYFSQQEQIEIIQLNERKDDTDTEYAIREAIRRGATKLTVLGATGSRLDHVLANIGLLGIGLQENVSIELLDTCNRVRLAEHEFSLRWQDQYGTYISLLPYAGSVRGLTVEGTEYTLENADLEPFNSLGISNEIVEDDVKISWDEGYLLIIESKDEKNSN
jgi:thiamine pyrophosphokinase